MEGKAFSKVLLVKDIAHVRSCFTPRRCTAASLVLRFVKLGISRYRRVLARPSIANNNNNSLSVRILFVMFLSRRELNSMSVLLFTFWGWMVDQSMALVVPLGSILSSTFLTLLLLLPIVALFFLLCIAQLDSFSQQPGTMKRPQNMKPNCWGFILKTETCNFLLSIGWM